jgi:tetratricopeptide (TPR) repeat protein
MEILDGTLRNVIRMALPVTAGGDALDREAADAAIARKGATAAQMRRDARALASFREILDDDPWLAILEAQGLELEPVPDADRLEAWRRALRAADNDRDRSMCAARLVELGEWPIAEAEDMAARSVMPSWIYKIMQAKAAAVQGQPGDAVRQLRSLAEEDATAAMELIRLLDRLGDPTVVQECERQYRRWNDGILVDLMLHLSVPSTGSEQLWLRFLGDSRLSGDTRSALRRRLIRAAADRQDWPAVIELCQAGLTHTDPIFGQTSEAEDADLAWQMAAAYFNLHDMGQARTTLDRYRLVPASEDAARLWVRLRLGTDLTAADAELAADLAEQYGRDIAEPVSTMLLREMHRHQHDGSSPWPRPLLDGVHRIIEVAQAHGYGPERISDTALLRRLEQTDHSELDRSCRDVQAGRIPLARFAAHAGRPYGQVLLQRAAGMIVAADPEASLNAVGRDTARYALDADLVVADLSSLHVLNLLGEHGRDLRARLPRLVITESTKIDAIASRDAIWAVTGSSFTAGLDEGRLIKQALSGADRARLRVLSTELEDLTARLSHEAAGIGGAPAFDSIALAGAQATALYSDDVALRQAARAERVPAFGTCDLIAALDHPATDQMLLLLAGAGVVDLPLTVDHIIQLEHQAGWSSGAGALAISRRQWWQRHQATWRPMWIEIAEAAARHSPDALTTITKAALYGSLQHSSMGTATQRYQQIVVLALEAVHVGGSAPPPGFLNSLAAPAAAEVVPQPKHLYHALRDALQQRGVADPIAAAAALLPEINTNDPALWM